MTPASSNFYHTSGTLPHDARCYVPRRADEELYEGLKRGEFCYVLTSRQMGKSSLMGRTAARLKAEGTAVVVLDLTAIGQNLSAEQWYDGLLNQVGRKLDLEDELEKFWLAHERLGPLQRWMAAIREVALPRLDEGRRGDRGDGETGRPESPIPALAPSPRRLGRPVASLVVFIDEIDTVRSLPFSTDEFFAAIRECFNRRTEDPELHRLTFCLLGVATPSDLIEDTRTTPFNIGRRIELNDFTPEEAAPLAFGLLNHGDTEIRGGQEPGNRMHKIGQDDRRKAQALLSRILYWTGGHPYLTQRLCQALAEQASTPTPNPQPPTPKDVDRLCEELFLSHKARERDDNLLFVRDRLLRCDADRAALLDLYGQVVSGKRVADDEMSPLVGFLRLSGVTRAEQGTLVVRNRIYARVFDRAWVREHMPDAELRRQKVAYRRGLVRAAAVGGTIVAVVAGLALGALYQKERAEAATEQERLLAARLGDALGREKDARLEAQRLLYDADMSVANSDWTNTEHGRTSDLVDIHRPVTLEAGSFDWFYLWRLCHGDLFTLTGQRFPLVVAFSPNGKRLAVGSGDGLVKLWDATTGRAVRTLAPAGPGRSVAHVRFSADGSTLTSVSVRGAVLSWDTKTGRRTRTLSLGRLGNWFPDHVVVSPDGHTLAAPAGPTIRLHDLTTGRLLRTLNTGPTSDATFSPDGAALATAGDEGRQGERKERTITIWEVKTGRPLQRFPVYGSGLRHLVFSPDGRRLAMGDYNGLATVWDIASRQEIRAFQGHRQAVNALAFSPDGRWLATGSKDGTAKLWDLETGQMTRWYRGHTFVLTTVAFSPDGKALATASADGAVKLWDVMRPEDTPSQRITPARSGHLAFSRDGRLLATGDNNTLTLWDAATRQEVRTLKAEASGSLRIAFSPDNKALATLSRDGTITLLDVATGRAVRTIRGDPRHMASFFAFSPDWKAVATGSKDGSVTLREVATGRQRWTQPFLKASTFSLAFAPDGRVLAVAAYRASASTVDRGGRGSTVYLLDAATGRTTRALLEPTSEGSPLAFSPDGKLLAAACWGNTSPVWEVATGRILYHLAHPTSLDTIAFSPDGKRLVTGSSDGTIKLWDVTTGRELFPLAGITGDCEVAFSPDGRRLAAAGQNGVMLWEAAGKAEVAAREARAAAAR